jgi:hypothetical protein
MNVTLLKCVEPGARNREGSFVGGRCWCTIRRGGQTIYFAASHKVR